MQTVTLDNTGQAVSRACLGTMTFGAQADESESSRILDCALDSGINFVDTANIYAKGASEEILGRALRGRRHQVVLASKVCGAMGDSPLDRGLSAAAMEKALEDTLRRLQTDYLDIYYLHQPDYDVPLEEALDTLDRMIRRGNVRFAANSNFASWQVCHALWIAEKNGYQTPRITQPMYNLLARGVEQEYVPMARQFGVSIIAYNPLAGGLLTGKHSPSQPAAGSRFVENQAYRDRYWHPQYLQAVGTLKGIASQAGRTLISLSLGWLLHHTATSCVVLGASRVEQLKTNLQAVEEGPLGRDIVQQCDEVWMRLKGCTPQYNR
jgi:aryl-alcohol dehydrogenase-like predicted oxidoreductase